MTFCERWILIEKFPRGQKVIIIYMWAKWATFILNFCAKTFIIYCVKFIVWSHLILETAKLDLNSKWSSHSFKLLRSLIVRNKDLASLIKKPTLTNAECNSCSSRVGLLICSGLKNKPLLPNFYSWDISFYSLLLF